MNFAKKNNLKVGDKLDENPIFMMRIIKKINETEVTIVGTFSGKKKGRVTAPQNYTKIQFNRLKNKSF